MPPSSCEPGSLALRHLRPGDEDVLLTIFASTREQERQLLGWSAQDWDVFIRQQFAAQHTQYMHAYANPSFSLVLCGGNNEQEGAVVGRLYVDRTPTEIRIIDIALLPTHRGQGIARQLLQMLVDESDASGIPLGLHVERHNPACTWYARLGFAQQADRDVYLYLQRAPQPAALPTPEALVGLAGSDFALTLPGEPVPTLLRLQSVTQHQRGHLHTCSLHFIGPDIGRPAHANYTLAHPRLGRFQLFLGPVMGGKADAVYYQSVITRLIAPPTKESTAHE